MNELNIQPWWVLGLRGVVAIAFGALALLLPGLTLLGLIILFAAYALLGGAASLFGAVKSKNGDDRWLPLLLGLVSMGAGALALLHPGLTVLILVLLIGANALVTGVLDIVTAIRLRKILKGEWLLGLTGVVSVIFGALLFLFPGAGTLALIWLISLYALFTGVLLLGLAFHVRGKTKSGFNGEERRVTPDRRTSSVGEPHHA
jgi:uncharacterized membrane protein HdeD (DUF308 family)